MTRSWTALALATSLLAVAACSSTSRTSLSVATTAPPATTAAPGHRLVVYQDVSVEVPVAWPVIDGNQVSICLFAFPDPPTVYVGPQLNGTAPPCAPPMKQPSPRDGAWLQPGAPSADARPMGLPSGVTVEESRSAGMFDGSLVAWLHDVQIEIGGGSDPGISTAILDSLAYQPGRPDTPAAQACRLGTAVMPTPERLDRPTVIHDGQTTLAPPRGTDQPAVTATVAWATGSHGPAAQLETYRLILTRYSSQFPAQLSANGSYKPEYQDLLAWVIYSTSATPGVAGCGNPGVGVDVVDAKTGQDLGYQGE